MANGPYGVLSASIVVQRPKGMGNIHGRKPPRKVTKSFKIMELNKQQLSSNSGILLGPVLAKPDIRAKDVANAQFHVVQHHSRVSEVELTDEEYNVKMERLLKCIMAEAEIGKRIRKHAAKVAAQDLQRLQLRDLEELQLGFERERFQLMKQLKLKYKCRSWSPETVRGDDRFIERKRSNSIVDAPKMPRISTRHRSPSRQSPIAPKRLAVTACATHIPKATSSPKNLELEPYELSSKMPEPFAKAIEDATNGKEKAAGSTLKNRVLATRINQRPIVGNYIVPPIELRDRVRAKLLHIPKCGNKGSVAKPSDILKTRRAGGIAETSGLRETNSLTVKEFPITTICCKHGQAALEVFHDVTVEEGISEAYFDAVDEPECSVAMKATLMPQRSILTGPSYYSGF